MDDAALIVLRAIFLVPRGGVVRSEEVQRRVVAEIESLGRALRLEPIGAIPSPIRGARGNAEFLLGFRVN